MKASDRVSSITLLIVGLLSCVGAIPLRIGSFKNPGSGFFPFMLGMVICILCLLVLIKNRFEKERAIDEQVLWSGSSGQKKVVSVLLGLTVYGLLLERLGYLFTMFLLIVFLLRTIEPEKWRIAIGGAFLASVLSYVLFELCLNVQLPRGFLGI